MHQVVQVAMVFVSRDNKTSRSLDRKIVLLGPKGLVLVNQHKARFHHTICFSTARQLLAHSGAFSHRKHFHGIIIHVGLPSSHRRLAKERLVLRRELAVGELSPRGLSGKASFSTPTGKGSPRLSRSFQSLSHSRLQRPSQVPRSYSKLSRESVDPAQLALALATKDGSSCHRSRTLTAHCPEPRPRTVLL